MLTRFNRILLYLISHEGALNGSLVITQEQVTYIEADMGNWCTAVTMGCECIEPSLENECSVQLTLCLREFVTGNKQLINCWMTLGRTIKVEHESLCVKSTII